MTSKIRSIARDLAIGLAFVAFFVLVIAETVPDDRPLTLDSIWVFAVLATVSGARQAYDHRLSGRSVMLARGVGTAIATGALYLGLIVVASWARPSVRAVAWLPPVLVGLIVIGVLVALVRRFLHESTAAGRRIALAENLALGLVPFGLWVAATYGEFIVIGGSIAVAGPVALLWLQRERRRRGLAIDPDPHPASMA